MKTAKLFLIISLLTLSLSTTGCRRNTDEVWEDSKSAGRHVNRGLRTMGGKHGDSRQIASRGQFDPDAQEMSSSYARGASQEPEFTPLADNNEELAMADVVSTQPRETPGDPGSSIPGIDSFRDPSTIAALAGIFKNVHFELNSSLVKGSDNLAIVRDVADYLKTHPGTYIFVEGHCDERGPEAFNLALGSRRANAVRNLLLTDGVNPDNVFTISYGKERPLILEHHEEAWAQNRRAEFKVYQR